MLRIVRRVAGSPGALSAALLLALAVPAATWAAEIEEIVVTAEKREASLQETPIAVSAVSRETIETRGLDGLRQVQFAVPALMFNELADMAQMTMRGVGVDISEMSAEPGVAMHTDGVYRGGLVSSASLLFDLERIEVLRGPQGTLFGRNSTGGGVNVVTRLPGEEPAFSANALYGDYGRTRVENLGRRAHLPGHVLGARRGRPRPARRVREEPAARPRGGRRGGDDGQGRGGHQPERPPGDRAARRIPRQRGDRPDLGRDRRPPGAAAAAEHREPGGHPERTRHRLRAHQLRGGAGTQSQPAGTWSDDPRNPYSTGGYGSVRESQGLSAVVSWDATESVELKSTRPGTRSTRRARCRASTGRISTP